MASKTRVTRKLSVLLLTLALVSGWTSGATAQGADEPVKKGFTMQLSIGVGIQTISPDSDVVGSETKVGISMVNIGLGGFINPSFAVLFRMMNTLVYEEIAPGVDWIQISGVAGPAVQFWVLNALRLEAGLGVAFVTTEISASEGNATFTAQWDDAGFGLMLGAAWNFWHNQKHGLSVGLDYAPGFFEGGAIHNTSIVFGWQLF